MTITLLTHRLVRLAIAAVAVALAVTTTVSAQQAARTRSSRASTLFLNGRGRRRCVRPRRHFYGTARNGGMFDQGALFRLDAAGVVTSLKILRRRRWRAAVWPGAGIGWTILWDDLGGIRNGVQIRSARWVTTLHAFSETDMFLWICLPASDGNVYGLTEGGGDFGNGTIFAIDSGGRVRTIHSIPLSAGRDMTSLVKGSDGRFYVTAR